jgi:hypothetical protein
MGEAKRRELAQAMAVSEAVGLETLGGRVQVRWDDQAAMTPLGQMAFFIEFLTVSGVFERWVESCPLKYTSPNAPSKQAVLSTWLLSILAGHWRYAHTTALRADGVNPALLGVERTVSEDALRRALKVIAGNGGAGWLKVHLDRLVQPLLPAGWILDIDTTIKVLYGKQEGAEVGFNPKKPGRASHTLHTYLVSALRLVLDVEVKAGNESHANYSLPGLVKIIDGLAAQERPTLVRGDAGFGLNPVMRELERLGIPYLFKLRLTANVKRYVEKVFWDKGWEDAGQGWEGCEGSLKLSGWEHERRVVVLRRELKGEVLLKNADQLELGFVVSTRPVQRYEYAVLVTDLRYEVLSIAQLYRERADAENSFDELKNQWGWGGFTTRDLARCDLSAKAVALIYNWWSLFVRLANPQARLEAITSRPLLLSAVARRTSHAGQQRVTITPMHGDAERAKGMLMRVSELLQSWKAIAEQLPGKTLWQLICEHLMSTVARFRSPTPPDLLPAPA